MAITAEQRQAALDLALHAYGTAWIFERRAKIFASRLRRLAFLGLFVPLAVGALVLAFGVKFAALGLVLAIGGGLAAIQAVWSLWAIVAKWDDGLMTSWESQSDNNGLFKRFSELASAPDTLSPAKFDGQMRVLQAETDAREAQDLRREITEGEKRGGMRAGLRQFKRACAACHQVPTSMNPTQCDVCGKF